MEIIIATTSILLITGLVWLINKLPLLRLRSGQAFRICPICAGVSSTWIWILAGIYGGYLAIDPWMPIAAIAMGGSVVGIAYQTEKLLPSGRSPLLWKTLFIPAGYAAVYGLTSFRWIIFLPAAAILIVLAAVFFLPKRGKTSDSEKIAELEKKMEECC